jgi:multidrug efflux system outer membrane protein
MKIRYALVCALFTATGCSLAPSSEPPDLELPQAWRSPAEIPADAAVDSVKLDWWTAFDDTTLNALVNEALAANHDIEIAVARVDEARALARVAGADRFPQIDGQASYSKRHASEAAGEVFPGVEQEFERFEVSAIGSFEVDLFGRVRNETAAAKRDLLATEYTREAVRLAVESDVVSTYLELIALDRQADVTRETVESRRRVYQIIKDRYEGGLVSRLDLERARGERASAEATLPEIERQQRATENRLSILLGRMPGPITRGKPLEELVPPAIPAELPSQLLLRRPDVAAAEAQLAATSARIGAARANLFPSINLTGGYGSAATDASDLFSAPALIWNFGAGLLQPIFHGGRNRALVAAAHARQREAIAVYMQTAQGAFQDVEDALFAMTSFHQRRLALQEQSEALTSALGLAGERYREGESSFLDVLDAERSRLVAEIEYAGARRDELRAAVALYHALGGGFQREDD